MTLSTIFETSAREAAALPLNDNGPGNGGGHGGGRGGHGQWGGGH